MYGQCTAYLAALSEPFDRSIEVSIGEVSLTSKTPFWTFQSDGGRPDDGGLADGFVDAVEQECHFLILRG